MEPECEGRMRPPFETFKHPTCKGSYVLGSACGRCERCEWERGQLVDVAAEAHRPERPLCKFRQTATFNLGDHL